MAYCCKHCVLSIYVKLILMWYATSGLVLDQKEARGNVLIHNISPTYLPSNMEVIIEFCWYQHLR